MGAGEMKGALKDELCTYEENVAILSDIANVHKLL